MAYGENHRCECISSDSCYAKLLKTNQRDKIPGESGPRIERNETNRRNPHFLSMDQLSEVPCSHNKSSVMCSKIAARERMPLNLHINVRAMARKKLQSFKLSVTEPLWLL